MSGAIIVRSCDSLEDFQACVALQRDIWGEQDLEVEPSTMFVVAAHTGGQVLGAYDGAILVGFTLALAALRNGAPYLHSHMTGVHADYRDRGVGRMLKLFQRDEALSRDLRLIEWTFDPLELRNAHFNLNRLGAICRRYLPNLYGVTTSPLHRGLPTDRLVAEWYLDSPRVTAAVVNGLARRRLALPSKFHLQSKTGSPTTCRAYKPSRAAIREQFRDGFAKGYAAIAVATAGDSSAYHLAPWSDF